MNRIKELRLKKGISMAEAARDLEMPYTTYVNYEKGDREPNSETLIILAKYFNCTIDHLIGRDNTSPTNDGEAKEEYLLASRSKDGTQGIEMLTKAEYESAKAFIQTLRKNTNEDL